MPEVSNPELLLQKTYMANKVLLIIMVLFLAFGCREQSSGSRDKPEQVSTLKGDTIVGERPITDEIAGSAYRKRATQYFLIIDHDTSGFRPVFTESRDSERISLDMNINHINRGVGHNKRMRELKQIIREASKDYNLDSLSGIFIGRLFLTGDLAIKVTNEYKQIFGENYDIGTQEYDEIGEFLLKSQLAREFNEILKPHSLTVKKISIEKVFFTTRDELLKRNVIITDSLQVPDRILDCITWIIPGTPSS